MKQVLLKQGAKIAGMQLTNAVVVIESDVDLGDTRRPIEFAELESLFERSRIEANDITIEECTIATTATTARHLAEATIKKMMQVPKEPESKPQKDNVLTKIKKYLFS